MLEAARNFAHGFRTPVAIQKIMLRQLALQALNRCRHTGPKCGILTVLYPGKWTA